MLSEPVSCILPLSSVQRPQNLPCKHHGQQYWSLGCGACTTYHLCTEALFNSSLYQVDTFTADDFCQHLSWDAGSKMFKGVNACLRLLLGFDKDNVPIQCIQRCKIILPVPTSIGPQVFGSCWPLRMGDWHLQVRPHSSGMLTRLHSCKWISITHFSSRKMLLCQAACCAQPWCRLCKLRIFCINIKADSVTKVQQGMPALH